MAHVAEVRKKQLSKLDPNPKSKAAKTEKQPPKPPEPKPKPAAKEATPKLKFKKPKVPNAEGGQYLSLGADFKIAHKPGSAYSIFYSVVAELGHFAAVAKAFEEGRYSMAALKDAATAKELLDKILVPVEKLEAECRCRPVWREHAEKKTEKLKTMIKEGSKDAKEILANKSRCEDGSWTGNIPEMISTCVGFYNFLIESDPKVAKLVAQIAKFKKQKEGKKAEPNKNVKKFEEAGIVFRRYPLNKSGDRSFVMMFPKKYVDEVKTAIKVVHSIDEDAQVIERLEQKLAELEKAKD